MLYREYLLTLYFLVYTKVQNLVHCHMSVSLMTTVLQEWELNSLMCADSVDESIHRNLGTCGDGNVGDLHSIGFEVYGSSGYYELVCWRNL